MFKKVFYLSAAGLAIASDQVIEQTDIEMLSPFDPLEQENQIISEMTTLQ